MTTVRYKGRIYRVLDTKYLGNSDLYKLASRSRDGSPFGALKIRCK